MPTGDMAFKENSRGPGAHRALASREARDGGEVRDQPERAMGDCAWYKKLLTTVNNYYILTLLHGEGLSQLRRPEVPTGASFFLRVLLALHPACCAISPSVATSSEPAQAGTLNGRSRLHSGDAGANLTEKHHKFGSGPV